jgi:hypothetical protein
MTPEDIQRVKDLLPTTLGSEEIRGTIAADILRRSVFSARMASATYLAQIRDVCARVLSGEINQATAVKELMDTLTAMGHSPLDPGGLTNPASLRRLNLIVDTQTQMAASVARIDNQTEATLMLWPAWELVRFEGRARPRQDWAARWRAAGAAVNWQGAVQNRMVALKSSPIWQALGDGAGGFRDTLGNPYPPFAYSSGLDWMEVTAAECARLGLSTASAAAPESASLSPGMKDIRDAIERYGFPKIGEDL